MSTYKSQFEQVFETLSMREKKPYETERLYGLIDKMAAHEDELFHETMPQLIEFLSTHDIHSKETLKAFKKSFVEIKKHVFIEYAYRPKGAVQENYTALGIVFGTAIGTALSTIESYFLAIGISLGVAIGVSIGQVREKALEKEGKTY